MFYFCDLSSKAFEIWKSIPNSNFLREKWLGKNKNLAKHNSILIRGFDYIMLLSNIIRIKFENEKQHKSRNRYVKNWCLSQTHDVTDVVVVFSTIKSFKLFYLNSIWNSWRFTSKKRFYD